MEDIDNMSDEEFKAMQESQENEEDFTNYITMNIMLPPEALLSLVDAGLLDEEEVLKMIEALKSQAKMNNDIINYHNRDRNDKDYGKDWRDWSPFPEDYLHDEDLD